MSDTAMGYSAEWWRDAYDAALRQRDDMHSALVDARPYVFNVYTEALYSGQEWRAATAAEILGRVDAAISLWSHV